MAAELAKQKEEEELALRQSQGQRTESEIFRDNSQLVKEAEVKL